MVVEGVIRRIKEAHPHITEFFIQSDNAPNYHTEKMIYGLKKIENVSLG